MYLHHFMMNPDIYYRYKTMVLLLNQVLIQLPVLVYVFKGDIVTVGMLIAVKLFSVYFSGAVYVLWFKKSSRIPKVRARMLISAVLAVAAAAVFWMGLGNIVISGYVQLIIAVVLCVAESGRKTNVTVYVKNIASNAFNFPGMCFLCKKNLSCRLSNGKPETYFTQRSRPSIGGINSYCIQGTKR